MFYLAQLLERNGEYEYYHTIRLQTAGAPQDALAHIAQNWYVDAQEYAKENGKPYHEAKDVEEGDFYFNAGEVCVSVSAWQAIPESVFLALPHFITVFSR